MRKLSLAVEDVHVESYPIEDAPYGAGTVDAFQTEPASVPSPCTGGSCTYPPQLCRTCHCAVQDGPAAARAEK